MPAFLDPTRPIATCTSTTCEGCPAGQLVHCHFRRRDLAHFLSMVLPAFVTGGAGIARAGWVWLVPWAAIAVGYFGFLEIRVMCSHCPHYAEPSASLKCWANYGSPKLWAYRAGPMSHAERFWFAAGMVAVLAFYRLSADKRPMAATGNLRADGGRRSDHTQDVFLHPMYELRLPA